MLVYTYRKRSVLYGEHPIHRTILCARVPHSIDKRTVDTIGIRHGPATVATSDTYSHHHQQTYLIDSLYNTRADHAILS